MEETNINPTEVAGEAKRPQFLTVVCILTFIGSGIALLSGIWNLIQAPSAMEKATELQEKMDQMEGGGDMLKGMADTAVAAAEHAYTMAGIGILTALFSLLGAAIMWQQKKNGFYIYTAAQLLGLIAPILVLGFGLSMGIMTVIGGVFTIAFIGMYAANLKHML